VGVEKLFVIDRMFALKGNGLILRTPTFCGGSPVPIRYSYGWTV
jgi:hypothetical protein